MAKQATKSVVVQSNPLLNSIAQLLTLDETALLLALAERECVTPAKFVRKALRTDMFGAVECARGDMKNKLDKDYTMIAPLADRLGWLGLVDLED